MAHCNVKKNGAPSAGSHHTLDAVVADKWVRAAPIRGEMHPAGKDVAEVEVKAAADVNEKEGRGVHICKFDSLNYSIDSAI